MHTKEEISGHSEQHFTHYRNFWWNEDFLDLMAERLQLKRHHSLLDVGCGLCHWSKLLVNYLSKPARIVGVDNDIKWSQENSEIRAYFQQNQAHLTLVTGDAQALPFADNTFDMVTCQTVLIHVHNPQLAISEMWRVLKPGGTILCAEPNNRIQSLTKSSLSADDPIDEVLDHVKYALICERGKQKLGEGDSSIGDLVPGLLAEAGFENIEVYISDKAIPMYPSYDSQEQKATLQQWRKGNSLSGGEHQDYKYFKAFGNRYLHFYKLYHEKYHHTGEDFLQSIDEKQYHSAGGAILYLASGIKFIPGHIPAINLGN